MKALLIKDFRLLKNQRVFFATFGVFGILFLLVLDDPMFSIWYMTIALSSFVMSTISYDSYNGGEAYLFSLPISRKEYVREKYVYNFIMTGIAVVFTGSVSFIVLQIRHRDWPFGYILTSVLSAFVASNIVNSLNIPLDLKFRSDKTRVVFMVIWGTVIAVGVLVTFVCGKIGINVNDVLEKLFTIYRVEMLVAVVVLMALFLTVSYLCSVRIMEKKEF